jgi:hypothetical protein
MDTRSLSWSRQRLKVNEETQMGTVYYYNHTVTLCALNSPSVYSAVKRNPVPYSVNFSPK